jgi:hypothetical protein
MLNASVRFPPIIQNDRDRETGNYNSPPYGSLSFSFFLTASASRWLKTNATLPGLGGKK